MATKPSVRIPVWASSGTKDDPGAAFESAGWGGANLRVPFSILNWILNAFGQWIGWAETSIDEKVDTITVNDASASLFKVFEYQGTAGFDYVVYWSNSGLFFARNVEWQSEQWVSTGSSPEVLYLSMFTSPMRLRLLHGTLSLGDFEHVSDISQPNGVFEAKLDVGGGTASVARDTYSNVGTASFTAGGNIDLDLSKALASPNDAIVHVNCEQAGYNVGGSAVGSNTIRITGVQISNAAAVDFRTVTADLHVTVSGDLG